MAHFAELDENNMVVRVIVVDNKDILTPDGVEDENIGIAFCQNLLGQQTRWKQTSYNASFRKNYAAPGDVYNQELDAFIPPKPFDSWILDEVYCRWKAPIPYPNDGKYYTWSEEKMAWVSKQ